MMPMIREMIKRYPKLRGYRHSGIPKNTAVVNLDVLEKKFEKGETINPETLSKRGVIRNIEGKIPTVKVLGTGEVTKAFTVRGCKVSKTAKDKIEKAGGDVK